MVSRKAFERIAIGIGALLLGIGLSAPAAADHFGEKGKGGEQPPFEEPEPPPECDEDVSCCPEPDPQNQSSNKNAESNNVCSTGSTPGSGGDPVDAFTGRMFHTQTDLVVNGVVPIRMIRQYDSQSRYDSPLGYGWSFTYDVRLYEYPREETGPNAPYGNVVVRGWEGRRWRYLPPTAPSTQFIQADPDRGRQPVLEADTVSGDLVEYVLTYDSGNRALFDIEGRLYALETPQGNRLRFFYSASKMPMRGMSPYALSPTTDVVVAHVWQLTDIKEQLKSQVATNPEEFTGRSVHLSYDNTPTTGTGRLTTITSHDGREVEYSYEEGDPYPDPVPGSPNPAGFRGNLAGVVGAHTSSEAGIVEAYRYPATPAASPVPTPAQLESIHNLTYKQEGAGTEPTVTTYDSSDRVDTQTYGQAFWDFIYSTSPLRTTIQRTIVTLGATPPSVVAETIYDFNPSGFVMSKRDATLDRIDYVRTNGPETQDVNVYEGGSTLTRTITFGYHADGKRSGRVTQLSPTETITESWEYEGPFVSFRQLASSKPSSNVFRTESDFFIDAQNRPTNVQAIRRLKETVSGTDVYVTTEMTYDANGQLETVTPPDTGDHLAIRRLYHTAADDLPGATPPLIRNGLLKRIERIDANTLAVDPHLAREFDYDAAGNVIEIADAKGHVTDLAWDGRGRLVRETRHVGASSATWESTLFRYGAPNLAASGSPNLGNDPALDTSTPGEHLLQVEVGALGATGTSTPGRVQRFVVDERGNVLTVQRKDGSSYPVRSHHVYDSDDNRVKSSEPTASGDRDVTFTYDKMKRLTKVEDDAGNDTLFEYDALGNRTKVTEAITAQVTDFVYDDLDRLIEIQALGPDPDEVTKFEYDAVGNVTKVTDPKLQETDYAYDALSRLASVEQPLGQTTQYKYDDRDRLIRVVNARSPGPTLRHRYEFWGGLDEIEFYPTEADAIAETNLARSVAFDYDLEGNLVSASDDDSALGVSGPLFSADANTGYDERNRLHEHTLHYIPTNDVTLTSTYNAFGERAQLDVTQDTETLTHTWAFDAQGRLDEAEFPGSDPMDFTPLPDDSLQTLERASGVTTSLVYHGQGPIDTLTVTAPGSTQLLALDYALNEVQNITGLDEQYLSSDPDEPYVFGYDGGNRLTGADYPGAYDLPADASYSYDPAGNREIPGSSGDYDYDANNRLTVSPFAALSCYDDDGNLISKRSGGDCSTGTVVESFTWDAQNRLRTFSKSGTSAAYGYDPFGRRIKKTVGSDTTWYVWDGDRLLAEYDASGVRDVRYAYAGGFAPVQVAYENGTGAGVYDVHSDHLDTPRMLTDDSGVAAWRASYEAFGAAHVSSDPDGTPVTLPPDFDFNIRVPGQYHDAESGLHQNRHRYYDPAIGRYISADPIGQFGLLNRYDVSMSLVDPLAPGVDSNPFRYALGNPIAVIDPDGQGPIAVGVCVAIAGASALKDAYDFKKIGDEIAAAKKELERLEAAYEACDDPAKQLEILQQINDLKAEITMKGLAQAGQFGASATAVGFAIGVCPYAISAPTP